MDIWTFNFSVVALSELLALWLIWRLWRSGEHVFFKISLSVLALIPVVGPLLTIWPGKFPSRVPFVLQDRDRYSTDVQDRWQYVHSESDPARRFQKWLAHLTKNRDENP